MGIMTALTGGLWSRVTEERGVVRLSINPIRDGVPNASESFSGYDGSFKRFDPPLLVRLANFRADYRDTLDIQFLDSTAKTKTIPHYRFFEIWKGRQIGLDYETGGEGSPKTIVRVLEHWPRSTVSLDLGERAASEPPPTIWSRPGPRSRSASRSGSAATEAIPADRSSSRETKITRSSTTFRGSGWRR